MAGLLAVVKVDNSEMASRRVLPVCCAPVSAAKKPPSPRSAPARPSPARKPKARAGAKVKAAEPRQRRSPDQARTLLLDAAERLLSQHGPDAVGLRDVAREAGVSHGLITHYFKTYEGLVEAVFSRRNARTAESIVTRFEQTQSAPSTSDLVRLLLGIVSEPLQLRLVAWAMLTGRAQRSDFMPGRDRGLRPIADALHKAAVAEAAQAGTPAPSQDDVDYALLLVLGSAYGWGMGKVPLLTALGRPLDRKSAAAADDEVGARLLKMMRALLAPASR